MAPHRLKIFTVSSTEFQADGMTFLCHGCQNCDLLVERMHTFRKGPQR